jgi:hypothetical protein
MPQSTPGLETTMSWTSFLGPTATETRTYNVPGQMTLTTAPGEVDPALP